MQKCKKTILLLKRALGIPYVNRIDFFIFVYIKTVWNKKWFLYMNENYDDWHHRKTAHTYTLKKAWHFALRDVFIYKKLDTFQKARQFLLRFYIQKPYTWHYGNIMNFLKLALIYKKHDTLRYVTFLCTKARHFTKSKTIWDTLLYTKIRHFCVTRFFIEFFKEIT